MGPEVLNQEVCGMGPSNDYFLKQYGSPSGQLTTKFPRCPSFKQRNIQIAQFHEPIVNRNQDLKGGGGKVGLAKYGSTRLSVPPLDAVGPRPTRRTAVCGRAGTGQRLSFPQQ